MRKYIFIAAVIIIAALSVFFIPEPSVGETEAPKEPKVLSKMDSLVLSYDSLVRSRIDTLGNVGSAIAISYQGEIVYQACFGVKAWNGTDSIDAESLFRLASVSKTFTGVLAGKLAADSVLGLDERVLDYMPRFQLKDSVHTRNLSVRHILSHSSGLVPHAYDNMVEAKVPMRVIIDSLRRVNISAAPGELYGYQNVVFSLYDTLVQLRTGSTFAALMQEHVFEPFGMKRAGVGYETFRKDSNVALPHLGGYGGYRIQPYNDRYYNTNPAAGVNASISDMAEYVRVLSSMDSTEAAVYALDTVMSKQVNSPLKWHYFRKWDRLEYKYYGLGWRMIGYKGLDLAYHGGYVSGYRSEVAIDREHELGIVYLSNYPNGIGGYCVPDFLELFLGAGY